MFGSLTARENILVAAEIRKGWSGDKDGSNPTQVTEEILERVGITHVADERVDSMPTGLARLVELGRALATRPRLLLLDEPGSGLDPEETEAFGDLLLELAEEGVAILLVEHDVELVMRVCEQIYVLDFGKLIAEGRRPRSRPTRRCRPPTWAPTTRRRSKRKSFPADGHCPRAGDSTPPTGASRSCTASTSSFPRRVCSRCSGPTAPARRPR